ncbi:MAG TPA: hypothetical protein VH092_18970 [Urbifossiella sp.]|jgi:hypothetical protein|nr:hypothetical protein [Urbifossiella sp.]
MDAGRSGEASPLVPADRVRVAVDPVRVGPAAHAAEAHGPPKITLVREDGVVRAIDVVCSCGERIRILCEYA